MFASRTAYLIRRLKRPPIGPAIGLIGGTVSFLAVSLTIGLFTAWLMIDKGSALTTSATGPWLNWQVAGKPGADPYTRAYVARSGRLPMNSTNALYFIAETDGDGAPLVMACEYAVAGSPINADWWSLAAYHEDGTLIANRAERQSFNSTNIIRQSNGDYRVALARQARPGNWLPLVGDGQIVLLLRVYGPRVSRDTNRDRVIENNLPTITRVRCR